MDNEKFQKIINKNKPQVSKIGTLGEKTLHHIVKNYYEENDECQEVKVGPYYADCLRDNKIIEVQTRQFYKLIPKIEYFLKEGYEVRVVYPSYYQKKLYWVNKETGEITGGRLSPKKGKVTDIFNEIYSLRSFLDNASFHITVLLMDLNEYRLLDGWSENKKRGSHRMDRIPERIVKEINLDNLSDFNVFYPEGLSKEFDSHEYSKKAKVSLKNAQMALIVLTTLSVVKRIGKDGNKYLYSWNKDIKYYSGEKL